MHGILSYARFGLKRIDKAPREKLKEYFHEIEGSGKRLLNLLNDSLELAKLEAGRVDYDLQTRDIVGEVETGAIPFCYIMRILLSSICFRQFTYHFQVD